MRPLGACGSTTIYARQRATNFFSRAYIVIACLFLVGFKKFYKNLRYKVQITPPKYTGY